MSHNNVLFKQVKDFTPIHSVAAASTQDSFQSVGQMLHNSDEIRVGD